MLHPMQKIKKIKQSPFDMRTFFINFSAHLYNYKTPAAILSFSRTFEWVLLAFVPQVAASLFTYRPLAGMAGFGPTMTESKSGVLPVTLHPNIELIIIKWRRAEVSIPTWVVAMPTVFKTVLSAGRDNPAYNGGRKGS